MGPFTCFQALQVQFPNLWWTEAQTADYPLVEEHLYGIQLHARSCVIPQAAHTRQVHDAQERLRPQELPPASSENCLSLFEVVIHSIARVDDEHFALERLAVVAHRVYPLHRGFAQGGGIFR